MPSDPRQDLLRIFQAAVTAVDGCRVVREWLQAHPLSGPVYLIGYGKAACAMARGAHAALGASIRDAFLVTRRGAAEVLPWPVTEAGHPLPDEASLDAGERLIGFIDRLPADAQVLVLLSGGGSALVERPVAGMGLTALRELNRWLLGAGLDIHAMNAIRKRLSLLKGGRCLAISDVPGNDPRSIASGPLTPETAALPAGAALPDVVRAWLAQAPPLPQPGDACFGNVQYEILATNEHARRAAAQAAEQLGYAVSLEAETVTGDAVATGRRLAAGLLESTPGRLHVWGGETVVTLPVNPGRGGRNQSLALSAATVLRGARDVYLLAAGTDGSDGPTDDAGALVDGGTVERGEAQGGRAAEALARADAGTFLEASGDLVHTGPTGTNVMDLILGIKTR
jgi:hydroxypyruvate reductase